MTMKKNDNENVTKQKTTEAVSLDSTPRILTIPAPVEPITFNEWRSVITENFPDLLFASEIGLSIIAQILIKDITNPFALVLVDVPSAGKTITINFFSEIEGLTYATDKFTPASFVSNAANVKKEKLKEVDLLPRLQYKMFLIRDLATLFSKRDDDLNECLGIMTRVLDGEGFNTDSGIHGQRQYVGEYLFMLLAASTPISPRVWKMMGNLGSRLFFLNMNSKDKTEAELADQLGSTAYKTKEKACKTVTKQLLETLWSQYPEGLGWDNTQDNHELKIIIARCARLLACLRGVINLWKDRSEDGTEYNYTIPTIEKPDRINQLFYNLCRGHALVNGRTQLTKDDVRLAVELAMDSAPTVRTRLFRALIELGGEICTTEVEAVLNCSKPTALKEMETLKILGICTIRQESQGRVGEPEKIMKLDDSFAWFVGDDCKEIRNENPEVINKENLTLWKEGSMT